MTHDTTPKQCLACQTEVDDDDVLGFESEAGEPLVEADGTPVHIPHCGDAQCIDRIKDALAQWAKAAGREYVPLDEAWAVDDDDDEEVTDEYVLPPREADDEDYHPAYQYETFEAAGLVMLQSIDPEHERTWRIWINRSTASGELEAHAMMQDGWDIDTTWVVTGYSHDLDALEGLKEAAFEELVARAPVPNTDAIAQLARLIELW